MTVSTSKDKNGEQKAREKIENHPLDGVLCSQYFDRGYSDEGYFTFRPKDNGRRDGISLLAMISLSANNAGAGTLMKNLRDKGYLMICSKKPAESGEETATYIVPVVNVCGDGIGDSTEKVIGDHGTVKFYPIDTDTGEIDISKECECVIMSPSSEKTFKVRESLEFELLDGDGAGFVTHDTMSFNEIMESMAERSGGGLAGVEELAAKKKGGDKEYRFHCSDEVKKSLEEKGISIKIVDGGNNTAENEKIIEPLAGNTVNNNNNNNNNDNNNTSATCKTVTETETVPVTADNVKRAVKSARNTDDEKGKKENVFTISGKSAIINGEEFNLEGISQPEYSKILRYLREKYGMVYEGKKTDGADPYALRGWQLLDRFEEIAGSGDVLMAMPGKGWSSDDPDIRRIEVDKANEILTKIYDVNGGGAPPYDMPAEIEDHDVGGSKDTTEEGPNPDSYMLPIDKIKKILDSKYYRLRPMKRNNLKYTDIVPKTKKESWPDERNNINPKENYYVLGYNGGKDGLSSIMLDFDFDVNSDPGYARLMGYLIKKGITVISTPTRNGMHAYLVNVKGFTDTKDAIKLASGKNGKKSEQIEFLCNTLHTVGPYSMITAFDGKRNPELGNDGIYQNIGGDKLWDANGASLSEIKAEILGVIGVRMGKDGVAVMPDNNNGKNDGNPESVPSSANGGGNEKAGIGFYYGEFSNKIRLSADKSHRCDNCIIKAHNVDPCAVPEEGERHRHFSSMTYSMIVIDGHKTENVRKAVEMIQSKSDNPLPAVEMDELIESAEKKRDLGGMITPSPEGNRNNDNGTSSETSPAIDGLSARQRREAELEARINMVYDSLRRDNNYAHIINDEKQSKYNLWAYDKIRRQWRIDNGRSFLAEMLEIKSMMESAAINIKSALADEWGNKASAESETMQIDLESEAMKRQGRYIRFSPNGWCVDLQAGIIRRINPKREFFKTPDLGTVIPESWDEGMTLEDAMKEPEVTDGMSRFEGLLDHMFRGNNKGSKEIIKNIMPMVFMDSNNSTIKRKATFIIGSKDTWKSKLLDTLSSCIHSEKRGNKLPHELNDRFGPGLVGGLYMVSSEELPKHTLGDDNTLFKELVTKSSGKYEKKFAGLEYCSPMPVYVYTANILPDMPMNDDTSSNIIRYQVVRSDDEAVIKDVEKSREMHERFSHPNVSLAVMIDGLRRAHLAMKGEYDIVLQRESETKIMIKKYGEYDINGIIMDNFKSKKSKDNRYFVNLQHLHLYCNIKTGRKTTKRRFIEMVEASNYTLEEQRWVDKNAVEGSTAGHKGIHSTESTKREDQKQIKRGIDNLKIPSDWDNIIDGKLRTE